MNNDVTAACDSTVTEILLSPSYSAVPLPFLLSENPYLHRFIFLVVG